MERSTTWFAVGRGADSRRNLLQGGAWLGVLALISWPAPAQQAFDPRALQGQISQSLPSGQMEFLLREATRLQACLKEIDAASMAELRGKGEMAAAEVRVMCDAGQRDQAQAYAIDSARALADTPAAAKLQQCTGALSTLLDALPLLSATAVQGANVCDAKF